MMFETVSNRIPSSWVATLDRHGAVNLGPARWLRDDFWDAFFSGSPEELAVFEEERAMILEES
jgi:hypothetical protein